MDEIKFTWDEEKAKANVRKHHVSFEEATSVFADENARLKHDPEHSDEEDRFIILGFSSTLRILVVCHVCRQGDQVIRIISARKATRNERKQYGREYEKGI
ncbi:MAG: BrnT family toxin [bacterium]